MTSILFVCHGNICRSPMAEFVFRDLLKKHGLADRCFVASAATSTEEIGNPVHPGTRRKLAACGVPAGERRAVQMTRQDGMDYDYLIGMDSRNVANMRRIVGGHAKAKLCRLLDFTKAPRDIADPWYTGNFDATYEDISTGCEALLSHLFPGQSPR